MRWYSEPRREWSSITDVHGAAGASGWWQLVDGHALYGPWEAVELAWVPAGGVSGQHRHTRTHEIYFILRGEARFILDGEVHRMPPGTVAVTRRGSVHGLSATADAGVTWLVAEVPAAGVWPAVADDTPRSSMNDPIGPVDLTVAGELDLSRSEVDPLRAVGVAVLAAGQEWPVRCWDEEVFTYLLDGSVTVTANGITHAVAAQSGVTFTLGEEATVVAREPSRLYWIRAAVGVREP